MIPILLITGFLGSGKTTFINWLLEKHSDLKISVILNEFGDTKLESQFVKQHSEEIMELANGCMCCVAKSDIPRVISYILEHSPQTEYILIEASGLSDPDPVREALQTPPISYTAYLESTVCVIDAVNFEKMRTEHAIITSQIADADLVLLNKCEMAGTEQVAEVQSLVQALTPDIRVLQFSDALPPEIFMTKSEPQSLEPKSEQNHHHTHEAYDIYWFDSVYPLELGKVQAVMRSLPTEIVRIKGVVRYNSDEGLQVVQVQRVGSHFTMEPHEVKQPITKSTILFIGKTIDQENLKMQLNNCRDVSAPTA
jgi:G3E family GTPase